MATSLFICIAAFAALLILLRRDGVSLGLPIAYLFSLLLIHAPGAYAHLVSNILYFSEYVAVGFYFTTLGAVAFVAGVWAVKFVRVIPRPPVVDADTWRFSWFCLIGGWFFTYALSFLHSIPSLGAAVDRAGAIWMLGVMLGLRDAVARADVKMIGTWFGALAVYPVLMLLLGGFLSYGSAAAIIVLSMFTITIKKPWKVAVGVVVVTVLGLNLFVNYFAHRREIRSEVWGGAPLVDRIDASLDIFRDFEWFDPDDRLHLRALDQRLNQNFFVGLAATRIEQGSVDYLYGRSLSEGVVALVPRALWPDKPVTSGSPKIVAEMTGLRLNTNTSFGVGNVMEFQINFGTAGVIGGFFLLGFFLRIADRRAAEAVARGDFNQAIMAFLPGLALINPQGSIVEISSGWVSGLVGAYIWRWAWARWSVGGGSREKRREGTTSPAALHYQRPPRR